MGREQSPNIPFTLPTALTGLQEPFSCLHTQFFFCKTLRIISKIEN